MSDLPTKPGPYYWRKSDGDKWVHTSVVDCLGQLRGGNARRPYQEAVSSMGGQWLSIPTADELLELQAKAKMVDDGQEMMQLAYDANKMSLLVTPDNKEVVDIYTKATGYTCRKVRVCKEVETD